MKNIKLIMVSVLSILNILFLPIFDVWGGFFPSNPDGNFLYVVESFFTDSDSWDEWIVILTLSLFVAAVLILVSSLIGKKTFSIIATIIGIAVWIIDFSTYVSQNETYDWIPSDDCNICVGFWIAIILFVVSFVLAVNQKTSISNKAIQKMNNLSVETDNSVNQVVIDKGTFCPNCGNKIDKQSVFCGNCGYKF